MSSRDRPIESFREKRRYTVKAERDEDVIRAELAQMLTEQLILQSVRWAPEDYATQKRLLGG